MVAETLPGWSPGLLLPSVRFLDRVTAMVVSKSAFDKQLALSNCWKLLPGNHLRKRPGRRSVDCPAQEAIY